MDTTRKNVPVFLSVYSINIRGLASRGRQQAIVTELQCSKHNVFYLQETHIYSEEQKNKISKMWKGRSYWDLGDPFARGVAILIKENFPLVVHSVLTNGGGMQIYYSGRCPASGPSRFPTPPNRPSLTEGQNRHRRANWHNEPAS
jgi:hypothetical protein